MDEKRLAGVLVDFARTVVDAIIDEILAYTGGELADDTTAVALVAT
jgi:hypothetical protein